MSALQFLSKKSWHTATIRNNEKVWLKEQEAAKEKARIEELQKQLEEERKLEEVHRLEIESGRLNPAEVLKRRRLNWMYEHGPSNQDPEAAKVKEEKERDDMLLGKKEIDLEKLGDKSADEKGTSAAFLAQTEEKLREDPLFEIQKEKATSRTSSLKQHVTTTETIQKSRKPPKYTKEELAAKLARKEHRREVREERKRRREDRAKRKRERGGDFFDEERDEKDSEARLRDARYKYSSEERRQSVRSNDVRGSGERREQEYGLRMPAGGTRVAVTKEFVPKVHENNDNDKAMDASLSARPKSRWDERKSDPLDAEEKRMRFRAMKEDALRLEVERKRRVADYVGASRRESRDLESRAEKLQTGDSEVFDDDPAKSFARQAILQSSSAAGRIRQRRAWSANDGRACY